MVDRGTKGEKKGTLRKNLDKEAWGRERQLVVLMPRTLSKFIFMLLFLVFSLRQGEIK